MHKIERIKVEGFWEAFNITTNVHSDVTFFIGVNGTGKTTLINLVAATLLCDFEMLDKIPFKKIEILLSTTGNNKKPSITAIKKRTTKTPFPHIDFEVRISQSSEPERFSLDDIQEQMLVRTGTIPTIAYRRNMINRYGSSILEKMRELVQVSWLSIHRMPLGVKGEDRGYESTVDRKIEQLSNDLVRYFSSLSRQKDDKFKKFQETIFLSLLEVPPVSSYKPMNTLQTDIAMTDLRVNVLNDSSKDYHGSKR
jgi:hypothetical protein